MTFILFLASLAVFEYLTRHETPPLRRPPRPKRSETAAASQPTQGLSALANALDDYGRGNTPGTVIEPVESNKEPLDRV